MIYGCDISRDAIIGTNVTFNHRALGVVIHPKAIIEDDVYIEHHVCLGQKDGLDVAAPIIRKGCVIGAYAVLLGKIEIGEGTVVGACSLVLQSVPAHTIYYNKRNEEMKPNMKGVGHY